MSDIINITSMERHYPKEGWQPGRVALMKNIGRHRFKGGPERNEHIVVIELLEQISDGPLKGQQFFLSKRMSDSFGADSNLSKLVKATKGGLTKDEMRSGKLDVQTLVGLPCLVKVAIDTDNDKTSAHIDGVRAHDGIQPVPKATFDGSKLPKWIEDLCRLGGVEPYPAAESKHTAVDTTVSL